MLYFDNPVWNISFGLSILVYLVISILVFYVLGYEFDAFEGIGYADVGWSAGCQARVWRRLRFQDWLLVQNAVIVISWAWKMRPKIFN